MTTETYIMENEQGLYQLVNGNAESKEVWSDYEDAKAALIADNELQAKADAEDPELYQSNSEIHWVA